MEYTTEDVRASVSNMDAPGGMFEEEFDNWLAEHERRIAEQAWDEAEAYVHTKLHHKTDPMRSVDNNPYRSQS